MRETIKMDAKVLAAIRNGRTMRDDLNNGTAYYIRPVGWAESYWPPACDTLAEVVDCFRKWAIRCGALDKYKDTTIEAGVYLPASTIGCMMSRRLPGVTL